MNRTKRMIVGALIGIAAAIIYATLISTVPLKGAAELAGFCVPWALIAAAIGYFAAPGTSKPLN
jgi:hypothetical protein